MDWRLVPSLTSLRAFEAASRLGSLSGAARELNVSHAAVAQHIRKLESHFGTRLLRRDGGGMRTTEDGHMLAQGLSEGFGAIIDAARDLFERDAVRPLRLALTPSFAANWLMPRIGDFWATYPGIELEMMPSPFLVDLRADGFDMALRYGRGPWPNVVSERLLPAGHAVVASPGLRSEPVRDLSELADQRWLMEHNNTEEMLWAAQNGLPVEQVRVRQLQTLSMVIEAVRAGLGLGILPRAIAAADIARGAVAVLFEEPNPDLAYHIVTKEGRQSEQIRAMRSWLRSQVKASA